MKNPLTLVTHFRITHSVPRTKSALLPYMLFLCLLFLGGSVRALAVDTKPIKDWIKFEIEVRDRIIPKDEAKKRLPIIMQGIRKYCDQFVFRADERWVFPLKGYDIKSIGGKNGNGYQPDIVYGASPIKGYDFFDGNNHGGHPAHDIFINDKNQDLLDDSAKQPVKVLSTVDIIVLSTYQRWIPGSNLRGGNVVWLYNPNLNMVIYYAHLDKIFVEPGMLVAAGEAIGTVGRTGVLAFQKRSPTHIHIMALLFQDGRFIPYNFYDHLKKDSHEN